MCVSINGEDGRMDVVCLVLCMLVRACWADCQCHRGVGSVRLSQP
jgi:hypothetical protein